MSRASTLIELAPPEGGRRPQAPELAAMAELARKVLKGEASRGRRPPARRERDENKLHERQPDHENTTDVPRRPRARGLRIRPDARCGVAALRGEHPRRRRAGRARRS